MAYSESKQFMFQIVLPDGKHILVHRTHVELRNSDDVKKLHEEIARVVSSNPDAVYLPETLRQISSHDEVVEAVKKLREEEPSRPLATDLGLDATNRLLTNPEIARTIAAARSQQSEA